MPAREHGHDTEHTARRVAEDLTLPGGPPRSVPPARACSAAPPVPPLPQLLLPAGGAGAREQKLSGRNLSSVRATTHCDLSKDRLLSCWVSVCLSPSQEPGLISRQGLQRTRSLSGISLS